MFSYSQQHLTVAQTYKLRNIIRATGQFASQDLPFVSTTAEAYAYHQAAGTLVKGALWLDANQ